MGLFHNETRMLVDLREENERKKKMKIYMMIAVLISAQFMGRRWYLQVPSSTAIPLFSLSSDNNFTSYDCQLG